MLEKLQTRQKKIYFLNLQPSNLRICKSYVHIWWQGTLLPLLPPNLLITLSPKKQLHMVSVIQYYVPYCMNLVLVSYRHCTCLTKSIVSVSIIVVWKLFCLWASSCKTRDEHHKGNKSQASKLASFKTLLCSQKQHHIWAALQSSSKLSKFHVRQSFKLSASSWK